MNEPDIFPSCYSFIPALISIDVQVFCISKTTLEQFKELGREEGREEGRKRTREEGRKRTRKRVAEIKDIDEETRSKIRKCLCDDTVSGSDAGSYADPVPILNIPVPELILSLPDEDSQTSHIIEQIIQYAKKK